MSADSTVRHARVKGMPDTSGATARSYAGAGPSGADGPIGPPAMNADADRPRTAHRTGGGAADGASDGGAVGTAPLRCAAPTAPPRNHRTGIFVLSRLDSRETATGEAGASRRNPWTQRARDTPPRQGRRNPTRANPQNPRV